MLKNICLLLCLCCVAFACSNDATDATAIASAQAKTVAQKIKTDSVKPRRYIIETARPKNQIKQTFPYDIDLKLANGEMINSETALQTNGKPTILLFWLTTCYPCRVEMKAIKKVYAQWKQEADFNLVAISTDFPRNYDNFVKQVNANDWPWQTYNDLNREFKHVLPGGLNGLPQTFILDAAGNVVYHKRKYSSGDEDRLFEKIKAISKT
ncbi:MAG: TlpA family protein disulfide reductase [Saprospiraceae bacterium]